MLGPGRLLPDETRGSRQTSVMVYINSVSKLQLAPFREFRLWIQKRNISTPYLNRNCTKQMLLLLFPAGSRKFQRMRAYLELVCVHSQMCKAMEETTKNKWLEKMKGTERMSGNLAHCFYRCSEHREPHVITRRMLTTSIAALSTVSLT